MGSSPGGNRNDLDPEWSFVSTIIAKERDLSGAAKSPLDPERCSSRPFADTAPASPLPLTKADAATPDLPRFLFLPFLSRAFLVLVCRWQSPSSDPSAPPDSNPSSYFPSSNLGRRRRWSGRFYDVWRAPSARHR
ncbi:hypothetical protein MRB53_038058 [Persea americana]|nr:hypothetical protein MRB53_038058 [Persea americana]